MKSMWQEMGSEAEKYYNDFLLDNTVTYFSIVYFEY